MGRNRSFDEPTVLAAAGRAFLTAGYEGTSIDELVRATGLLRGSLYQAFGSKRGLFLAVLRQIAGGLLDDNALDLVLIATLELAPRDDEVRQIVGEMLAGSPDPAHLLGDRLLARAGLPAPAGPEEANTEEANTEEANTEEANTEEANTEEANTEEANTEEAHAEEGNAR